MSGEGRITAPKCCWGSIRCPWFLKQAFHGTSFCATVQDIRAVSIDDWAIIRITGYEDMKRNFLHDQSVASLHLESSWMMLGLRQESNTTWCRFASPVCFSDRLWPDVWRRAHRQTRDRSCRRLCCLRVDVLAAFGTCDHVQWIARI